ncbi:hypothetical protein E4631_18685 [Hymenobacter sp. UV11]|uniref:hypothetical protein n=1 Tax=Hymenobacter sp. UV11 TaxID=1849735 RepID=UPI00105E1E35|nr:hypothetical protein [Hymenobacter sp. UV11]TDN36445.1 hypothetical protein A8B98_08785 [Hymenobacter sp. UV11]TFZ64545.1 hypothetical protein E4631_18685 [Hymenobacter sp. UV11]
MARTLLLVVLAVAILLELGLTGGAFFAPMFTLAQFGVVYGPETKFLAYLTGWFLLFVTLAVGLAWMWVRQRHAGYAGLCYLLGSWWIGIGIGIFVVFGKPDNLLLDSLKGLFIVVLTWRSQSGGAVRPTPALAA